MIEKKKLPISVLNDLGKIPPSNIELESVILGTILVMPEALNNIEEFFLPEIFYSGKNGIIAEAILSMYANQKTIDITTVANKIKSDGNIEAIGGSYYLSKITEDVGYSTDLTSHIMVVYEFYLKRKLIEISGKIAQESFSLGTDVFDTIAQLEAELTNISRKLFVGKIYRVNELIDEARKNNERLLASHHSLNGVPSGFVDIDNLTGGWQPSDLIIMAARPGQGKCLGYGTKVLMFDGSLKEVQEISTGELLMGADSKPRNVLSTTTGSEMMYIIHQNKGITYRVNESHILSLKASGTEGIRKHGEIVNISVKDYLNKSKKFQIRHKGYKVPIEFNPQHLEIEPYFIGVWLGDGSKSNVGICKDESELTEYLSEFANRIGLQLTKRKSINKCLSLSITNGKRKGNKVFSLQSELRKMGLLNNKHIPQNYLINSKENRLELLAGLLDTDGYLDNTNCFEIIQKNELLAYQIKFLADTLGFKTSIKPKIGKIKSRNFEGKYFRVRISGNIEIIPTKIKRKQSKGANRNKDWRVTGITISKDKIDTYYGFELDGDGLFLLEDMTVTHNTSLMLQIASNAAIKHNKSIAIFSLEMAKQQLVARLRSQVTGIQLSKYLRYGLDNYEQKNDTYLTGDLYDSNIFIDDTGSLNLFELRTKARKLKRQHNIDMILVDFIQMMGMEKSHSKDDEVGKITRGLKQLAKELNIPVIALSSLNREVEKRPGKVPQLSDLRESGNIESDADIVFFIYRPEYYGIMQDANGNSTEGIAHILFAKHRNGGLGNIQLNWRGDLTTFYDLPHQERNEF